MDQTRQRLRLAIESFASQEVPDGRTRVCDLFLEETDEGYKITGTVSTHSLAQQLHDQLGPIPEIDRERSSVQILTEFATDRTVSETSVPVRASPNPDGEQVTQVLYGDTVVGYDSEGEWRRISAPDGYIGWMRDDALENPVTISKNAAISSNIDSKSLNRTDGPSLLPAGSPCEVNSNGDGTVSVEFRTGFNTKLSEEAVTRWDEFPDGSDIVSIAQQFTGMTYEWGGMTSEGIDCSGLVWVCYRVYGIELPRDTDQQEDVGQKVHRDDLQPGDLLFFPGHVAISLGGQRYIHAHGTSDNVVENSFDPEADDYLEDLDKSLTCCRRLLNDC